MKLDDAATMARNLMIITVWAVTYDDTPQGYTVKYPPLERYVKAVHNVPELKKECAEASSRYTGKEDTIVTSGFVMIYDPGTEPKMRGLNQFWERGPFMTKKAAAAKGVAPSCR